MIALILSLGVTVCAVRQSEFEITIAAPPSIVSHFKGPLEHVTIMPGLPSTSYQQELEIKTLSNNKFGCRKYTQDFGALKGKLGILLVESDNCSIATKIHYAQLAGAAALFLRYNDDNIHETEIDRSSFDGVLIPVFLLTKSDATKIGDIVQSSEEFSQLVMRVQYRSPLDSKEKRIRVFMSPQLLDNPMIPFLRDLLQFQTQLRDYALEVNFAIGFCKSCKEKGFMRKEPGCLSAGRYCIVAPEAKTNELTKEAVRQICIRNAYPPAHNLVGYLAAMKAEVENLREGQVFKEKDLEGISRRVMAGLKMDPDRIQTCYVESFLKHASERKTDPELNDNDLLRSEQKEFQEVNKYNIFPLLIVNGIYYDRGINIREFVGFACKLKIFDCRGFARAKSLFVVGLATVSLSLLATFALFCRRAMKRRMESELGVKVNEAVHKYLTVEKS